MFTKHGRDLVPAFLKSELAKGSFSTEASNTVSCFFVIEITADQIRDFSLVMPTQEVFSFAKTPFGQFTRHSRNEKSSTRHCFITSHVGFLRELLSTYIDHDLACFIDLC